MQDSKPGCNGRHYAQDLSRIGHVLIARTSTGGDFPGERKAFAGKRCVTQGRQTLMVDGACPECLTSYPITVDEVGWERDERRECRHGGIVHPTGGPMLLFIHRRLPCSV